MVIDVLFIRLCVAVISLCALAAPTRSGAVCRNPARLKLVIPSLAAGKLTPVEAILKLGQQEHLCFGLRNFPKSAFIERKNFAIQNQPLESALKTILPPEYDFKISVTSESVVYIRVPSQAKSLFDHRLAHFHLGRVWLQSASTGLHDQLALSFDPSIKGFAGSFRTGDTANLVGPMDLKNRTVAQLLNALIGGSNGATWIAGMPDKSANIGWENWVLIDYDRPAEEYFGLLKGITGFYPPDAVQPREHR